MIIYLWSSEILLTVLLVVVSDHRTELAGGAVLQECL